MLNVSACIRPEKAQMDQHLVIYTVRMGYFPNISLSEAYIHQSAGSISYYL